MKARRRLMFQLTPLLDLLLIVIFAQYMEVQQTAESGQQQLIDREAEMMQRMADREAAITAAIEKRQAELESWLQDRTGELTQRQATFSEHYNDILRQHQRAGSVLAEQLNLPGRVMEQILKLRNAGSTDAAAELKSAAEQLADVLPERSDELFNFLLRYDEMDKHVSVWEMYLQDNGQAVFTDGTQQQQIAFENVTEFVTRSFEASKSFSEPKPLVIILMSHGDTQAGRRRQATEGLTPLVQQLRSDAGNTRWFDFSLLGFRPTGPVLKKPPASPFVTPLQP